MVEEGPSARVNAVSLQDPLRIRPKRPRRPPSTENIMDDAEAVTPEIHDSNRSAAMEMILFEVARFKLERELEEETELEESNESARNYLKRIADEKLEGRFKPKPLFEKKYTPLTDPSDASNPSFQISSLLLRSEWEEEDFADFDKYLQQEIDDIKKNFLEESQSLLDPETLKALSDADAEYEEIQRKSHI